MDKNDTVVAVFATHDEADAAVRNLAKEGFALKDLSVVGKGYHTEDHAVGFYNIGDRVRFWGKRGLMWGGLWGMFFGGLFLTIPVVGHVIILGYLAVVAASAVEGAVTVGGLSAVGAALASIGVPHDSVVQYETVLKADSFLVMAHGTADEMTRAHALLAQANATSVEIHRQALTAVPAAA
jgi:uncharacterized membrane protein